MALRSKNVTITTTGTAQSVHPLSATVYHTPVKYVRLESETSNADVKVGDKNITATTYGMILEAGPTKYKEIGPFGGGDSPFNLEDIWVIGTATQIIHILYVTL